MRCTDMHGSGFGTGWCCRRGLAIEQGAVRGQALVCRVSGVGDVGLLGPASFAYSAAGESLWWLRLVVLVR